MKGLASLTAIDWLFIALGVVLVASVVLWLLDYSKEVPAKDPVISVDQWTETRRAQLAKLQQPAAKGWQGRRRSS